MKSVLLALCGVLVASGFAHADSEIVIRPNAAERFAALPPDAKFPEGIAANPRTGDVYVGTFNFGAEGNRLLRFNRHGGLLGAITDFPPLLGLRFNRADRKVYIANFGASLIQRVRADFRGSLAASDVVENVASIPSIGAPADRLVDPNPDGSQDRIVFGSNGFPAPNALTFDSHGDLYVSDSFQGAIFKIEHLDACPCTAVKFIHDPLLATAGFPPFGANGLALDKNEETLFVANTGDDRVLKIDLASKAITVFAESINGADSIAFGRGGVLWVAANQADEIVGLNGNGRVIARLGAFRGIANDGAARGLLFPASLVLVGGKMFVANLALPLTAAVGDEPEEDVATYTISEIDLGDDDRHDDD